MFAYVNRKMSLKKQYIKYFYVIMLDATVFSIQREERYTLNMNYNIVILFMHSSDY